MLSSTNEFISDLESFASESESNMCIQAIEKSEILSISKDDLDVLYKSSLYWNILWKKGLKEIK